MGKVGDSSFGRVSMASWGQELGVGAAAGGGDPDRDFHSAFAIRAPRRMSRAGSALACNGAWLPLTIRPAMARAISEPPG
ncbi:MAG: hypothetical protein ACYCYK_07365 [Candidatus Dormibacteria bacterium]